MGRIYSLTATPHMVAWPPLMDWLRAQGLDPGKVAYFVVADDERSITVTELVKDAKGRRIIDADPDGENPHARKVHRVVTITSPPPEKTA